MRPPLSRRPAATVVTLVASFALLAGACAADDEAAEGAHLGAAAAGVFSASWAELTAPPLVETEPAVVEPAALPDLPVPAPLPLDAYQPEPEVTLGTISIPRLGLADSLHQGMSLTALNRGPSHWPGTAAPGQLGNMVIGGHRTTYTQPFLDLDLIRPGDEMTITDENGTHVYRAERTEIVEPEALWISEQDHAFTATTFACHPKGSARQRIVVFWQLVDADGDPVPGPA